MLKKKEIDNAIKYFSKERNDILYCLKLSENNECTKLYLKKIINYEIAIECMKKTYNLIEDKK